MEWGWGSTCAGDSLCTSTRGAPLVECCGLTARRAQIPNAGASAGCVVCKGLVIPAQAPDATGGKARHGGAPSDGLDCSKDDCIVNRIMCMTGRQNCSDRPSKRV